MRTIRIAFLGLSLSAGLLVAPSPAATGGALCTASDHIAVTWSDFTPPATNVAPPRIYWTVEPNAPATSNPTLTVRLFGEDCPPPEVPRPAQVRYTVEAYPAGTGRGATAGVDFTPVDDHTGPLCDTHQQGKLGTSCGSATDAHSFTVTVLGDATPLEPVAERARALLHPPAAFAPPCGAPPCTPGRLQEPFDVPLWIVDDDGIDRGAFETAGVTERSELYPSIAVAVFRAGAASAPATFGLSAQGSGASPASPGEDFTLPTSVSFGVGERAKLVEVAVVNDKLPEPDEELTITLTNPGPVLPDDVTSTVVRILDNEEGGAGGIAPRSRFHHPKHKKKYVRGDYRLREFHVFATDEGGAGVASVAFALRQKTEKGTCRWFGGKRFRKGPCGAQRWVSMEHDPNLDWYYFRLPKLKPSVRSTIRSYRAWSRAIDDAGNVETQFRNRQNRNTFEVLKG